MPFLLNEDDALKTHLAGITVADEKNNHRTVGVWFGQPDAEIRAQNYPYLTIELVDIGMDRERAHSGLVELPYQLEGQPPLATGAKRVTEFPIPINLDYQITSYARHPRHDRMIMSQMIRTKTPFKFGGLDIPADGTIRPLFLTGFASRDGVEGGKRLFMNVFTIRVFSEITPSKLHDVQQVITRTITINTPTLNSTVN